MLSCLEVVEYSLKERFNTKYKILTPGIIICVCKMQLVCAYRTAVYPVQHQVSYLRWQDVISVCLLYYSLPGYPVQRVYLS